jgi:hypothetical protein
MAEKAKWKKKLGVRLMGHVWDTTENGTLAEVKRNIAHLNETRTQCTDCEKIARKLGITEPSTGAAA